MISRQEKGQASSVQVFRLVEGSLVTLFFLEAARAVLAVLLYLTDRTIETGQVNAAMVNGHLLLIGVLALTWFSPRPRSALPEVLSISAILSGIARVVVSVEQPAIRLYAGLATLALGGVYLASLLRANTSSWLAAITVGLALDQALRASGNTFDPTLASTWIAPQIVLSLGLAAISRAARRQARHEPYEPAFLTLWGGLAFGGLLALETFILGSPNVMARRSHAAYGGIVPWLMLASTLPLLPGVRAMMGRALGMFDERLRGGVWMALLLLLVVIGGRLRTAGAASTLIVAQFMAILSLWWIPRPSDPLEMEQVGPSLAVGLLAFVALVYAYTLAHIDRPTVQAFGRQQLPVILVAAGLLGIPRLFLREEDPWLAKRTAPRGIPALFIAPIVSVGLIFGGRQAIPAPAAATPTLRVATYNINGGFDEAGAFRPAMLARTIEASRADVVVLQEVETGRPLSYGMDHVVYLSRRLGMWAFFQPVTEENQGIAILSRWPIVSSSSQWLPGEQQMAILAVIAHPSTGHELTILGTELMPGNEESRLGQALALIGFAGNASPAVLGADLAGPPEDVVYQQLVPGQFIDPETVLGIEQGYTVPASQPQARHDYVLVRSLTPLASQQVNSTSSDHRLVVVEVGWP
jgi:endonuclease/exonuclease/phosphatase family metal-dependent hydrolase